MKTSPNPVNFYKIRTATEATQYLEKEKRRKKKEKGPPLSNQIKHPNDQCFLVFREFKLSFLAALL